MPRLSEFHGIVITMYWRDHALPHDHAAYGDQDALIVIEDASVTPARSPVGPCGWSGNGTGSTRTSSSGPGNGRGRESSQVQLIHCHEEDPTDAPRDFCRGRTPLPAAIGFRRRRRTGHRPCP